MRPYNREFLISTSRFAKMIRLLPNRFNDWCSPDHSRVFRAIEPQESLALRAELSSATRAISVTEILSNSNQLVENAEAATCPIADKPSS
jgi:hypothetical protein